LPCISTWWDPELQRNASPTADRHNHGDSYGNHASHDNNSADDHGINDDNSRDHNHTTPATTNNDYPTATRLDSASRLQPLGRPG